MSAQRDEKRGHIYMAVPHRAGHKSGRCEVIAADLGPTLHLTAQGAHLTPDEARELGAALTWWADRPRGTEVDLFDATNEVHDLFDLLEEDA